MKKILTFLMVFVALFTFVACDTGNSSSGNGGNGTSNVEVINPDDVAKEFADCTTDVDVENMVISDGSWTVIEIYQDAGRLRSVTLQATVEDNYLVPVLESGVIIFIGNKDDLGNNSLGLSNF